MFLKNICNERTMEWEVVSAASIILPCCVGFSPCLDVSRIKRLLIDALIGRVITAQLWPGVGGREAVLGIIVPVWVTIQVRCPSSLRGGLVSRWEWLWCYLISARGHTDACFCRLRIVYKCRAVAESDSLDIEPSAGSLILAAPVCRLAAEFRLCGLIYCEDCFWIIACRALRFIRHWRVTLLRRAGKHRREPGLVSPLMSG